MSGAQLLDARRVLFGGMIDCAGLLPPTSLEVDVAVERYRAARRGRHGWALGRFVCPASQLETLAGMLTATMAAGEEPWPISVVLDGDLGGAVARTQTFAAHMGSAVEVVFAERHLRDEKPVDDEPDGAAVLGTARAMAAISPGIAMLLEAPVTGHASRGLREILEAIRSASDGLQRTLGATVRLGGATTDTVPSEAQVARFLAGCRDVGIPFKAAAGLDHAIRRHDPELDVPVHGFVNVLVASALAVEGAGESTVAEVLSVTDQSEFSIRRSGVVWRSHRLNTRALRRLRHDWLPSLGSHSFDRPIAELIAIGALES